MIVLNTWRYQKILMRLGNRPLIASNRFYGTFDPPIQFVTQI